MLTPDDLKAIGALLDEKLSNYPTKTELGEKLKQQKTDILAEMDSKLEQQTKAILEGTADYVADSLTPYLEKQDRRLDHLERHTTHPPGAPVVG